MTTGTDLLAEVVESALSRGLISVADLHDHGLRAWDASRSHDVVVIEVGGRGMVVKRHRRAGDDIQGSHQRELAAYRAGGASARLRGLLPALIDPGHNGLLVIERVAAPDLAELRRGAGRHDDALLRRTAAAIGRWHRHAPGDGAAPFRPWVLDALAPRRPAFLDSNDGARTLLEEVPDGTAAVLARAAAAWRPGALVHGDLRYDNAVVDGDRVTFIDWECAGWGDPAWDLAALVADALTEAGVREVGRRLAPPVRSALTALMAGYREGAGVDPGAWAERLGLLVAVRLLQRALQVAGSTPDPDPDGDAQRLVTLAVRLGSHPAALPRALDGTRQP